MRMIQTNHKIKIKIWFDLLDKKIPSELGLLSSLRENILHNISQLCTIVYEEMISDEDSSGER